MECRLALLLLSMKLSHTGTFMFDLTDTNTHEHIRTSRLKAATKIKAERLVIHVPFKPLDKRFQSPTLTNHNHMFPPAKSLDLLQRR